MRSEAGSAVAISAAAYLIGAVPVAQIIARRTCGADLRRIGTGTVSAGALLVVSGSGTVVTAGALDVVKGMAGALLARPSRRPLLAAAAAGATIAGHNWSPFLHGAGGRGFSPAVGALGVLAPEGAAVLLAGVALGRAVAGDSATGALAAYTGLPFVLSRTRGRTGTLTAMAVLVPIFGKRMAGNRRADEVSTYLWRLLYDRDQRSKP
ncbi:MAG TPA: glycerol-3-phosphate acyltransferase [Jiangellaceae bacterium]